MGNETGAMRDVLLSEAVWVATVAFTAEPGDTKVGLSPWYTYADYLRLVANLPQHPCLQKQLLGTSDGGREHWDPEQTRASPSASAE